VAIMTQTTPFDRTALRGTLDDIIDSHGLFAVLRALTARLALRLVRRRVALPPLTLSDHLRRDIGLEPTAVWEDPLPSGPPPLPPLAGRGGGG
jgi:hypothetical protein